MTLINQIPPIPNLQQLRNQAKDLRKARKAGDPDAIAAAAIEKLEGNIMKRAPIDWTTWPRSQYFHVHGGLI